MICADCGAAPDDCICPEIALEAMTADRDQLRADLATARNEAVRLSRERDELDYELVLVKAERDRLKQVRCLTTGHAWGTDTIAVGHTCPCPTCQLRAERDALKAEVAASNDRLCNLNVSYDFSIAEHDALVNAFDQAREELSKLRAAGPVAGSRVTRISHRGSTHPSRSGVVQPLAYASVLFTGMAYAINVPLDDLEPAEEPSK